MEGPKVEYIGPFDTTHVVIDGRQVPYLDAHLLPGGRISLTLDHRFGLDLTVEEAERVIPFLADCIAVAAGYASFPKSGAEPARRPDFPRLMELTGIETEEQ